MVNPDEDGYSITLNHQKYFENEYWTEAWPEFYIYCSLQDGTISSYGSSG